MRTVGVITVARSDYGIYLPLLRAIQNDPDLQLHLIVSGMHLSPEFGLTVEMIEADGFEIGDRVEMLLSSDTPEGTVKSMGLGIIGFAQLFARFRPDILFVLGDRFEMYMAALAALPFNIPIAHIHGGEITEGAIDDALRHSMTKLSHLHFVSTEIYAQRVIQLGEEPWRVTVSGALSLDNLQTINLLNIDQLNTHYGLSLNQPPLLVTFHPVTLEPEQTEWQMSELLATLKDYAIPIVFTMPNADSGSRIIIHKIKTFIQTHPLAQMVNNLGTQGYFSMMAIALAMVGNSSSGIIEAASFGLPVVNIGIRQQGRIRGVNVIDVDYQRSSIIKGLQKAIDPQFRDSLRDMTNPYGIGQSAKTIVERVKQISLDSKLTVKRFHNLEHVSLGVAK